jgi:hypothetical protein
MITELDNGCIFEHPAPVDHQLTVLQGIDVTLDQQQVGARLHGKESAARDVDAVCAFEVFDGCSCRCLELNDRLAIIRHLRVNDNL